MTDQKLSNIKRDIHFLYNCLCISKVQSTDLLNIEDMLLQV